MRRLLGILGLVVACGGCADASLDPLPFEISMSATPTTISAGESVTFSVIVQGGAIMQVGIDFDDGTTDGIVSSGARTARVTFRHPYLAAGTYDVLATAIDDREGPKSASIQVVVQ